MTKISHKWLVLSVFFFSLHALAVDTPVFKDESELGAAAVSGNTNSESYNARQVNEYDWDQNVAKIAARYLQTRANGLESAKNWDGTLRYERVLSSDFNIFADAVLESDVYAGYIQRNDFDLGGKYFLSHSEETKWSVEGGYRNAFTHYPASQQDLSVNALRLFTEFSQAMNKTATFKLWVEYVQSVSSNQANNAGYQTSQDYQVNTEPSINLMINQVLSFKTAYLFKYKNYLPPNSVATKYLDTVFTTSLVAKF